MLIQQSMAYHRPWGRTWPYAHERPFSAHYYLATVPWLPCTILTGNTTSSVYHSPKSREISKTSKQPRPLANININIINAPDNAKPCKSLTRNAWAILGRTSGNDASWYLCHCCMPICATFSRALLPRKGRTSLLSMYTATLSGLAGRGDVHGVCPRTIPRCYHCHWSPVSVFQCSLQRIAALWLRRSNKGTWKEFVAKSQSGLCAYVNLAGVNAGHGCVRQTGAWDGNPPTQL